MSRAPRALFGVPAPAKLNWFLHVLGRRADGMHELQTVFQFIDWCDELDFELRDDGLISREGGPGLPEDDLCVRAARLLQSRTGCAAGVHMRLRKRIPAQAGLGGGSSDAATVLLSLNLLWGLGLRRAELQQLGARLGADVPVFVFGQDAFAEGVGEQLRALRLPQWDMLVAWPGEGLSTPQVFASPLLTRDTPACTMEGFCEHLKTGLGGKSPETGTLGARTMRELLGFGANDLQAAALELLPSLRGLQDWLARQGGESGAHAVRMSGSGSAMFTPWSGRSDGGDAGEVPAGWSVRACRSLPEHPLRHWAPD
ncbi:MAG: 4-(cytidine 5'-diphospho)-2-C-methyl-D-erythritol kinase [Betaproteobacteria bacterium]|nr:4-(cytidine 5'-diphospho)-2-C-methyl-D-erythritol kinase [Betaproteobacteria bacterium]MBU6511041.1 4-(cytidine 5'-diphospho)-2-C-methyl-D-erythritol kinase [Betaproteobacteria bacterium]MDE2150721.1 4-(cytidine 5'-diphospho)-2-C-methyl-D-erythritol kinase [Betaproteobacteria bacterium]MDE2479431.1 4-(cytidine 5'-diphospho)-2-C-methyl-D-erythritol kinase [Betaproteobacteria bacterium]